MPAPQIPLTHARLKSLVHYDPETGIFTAIKTRGRVLAGKPIGVRMGRGYLSHEIGGRTYLLHRLAWLYMTGEWPPEQVDHRDENKAHNAWINLRAATNAQNQRNIRASKANTSGHRGVCWHGRIKKWQARIRVDYKLIHLGYFESIEDAVAARRAAEARHFGDFAPSPAA
jgi:hypothetical protein